MKPDFVISLGTFTFKDLEVPKNIPLGGRHLMKVHNLPGGGRVINKLGPVEDDLAWTGYFRGADALERARYLDTIRKSGNSLTLTWHTLTFTVTIETFVYDFHRFYEIPYSIKLVIEEDKNSPVDSVTVRDVEPLRLIEEDMKGVLVQLEGIDEDNAEAVAVRVKVMSLMDYMKLANSTIAEIKSRIMEIKGMIVSIIAQASNFIQNVTTFGGLLPNNALSQNAAKLGDFAGKLNDVSTFSDAKCMVERAYKNTEAVTSVSEFRTEIYGPGNLFLLAKQVYNDATRWEVIAAANGLKSPYLDEPLTLRIPAL